MKKPFIMNNLVFAQFAHLLLMLALSMPGFSQSGGLRLSVVAIAPTADVVTLYEGSDKGGNTSVAFDGEDIYKWSGKVVVRAEDWGYYTAEGREVAYIKRDRDLGQTFRYTGKTPKRLTAITLATGYGTNVVRANTYNQPVSIQIFAVTGEPRLNQNGSIKPAEALHGFPHNRVTDSIASERDDYFEGETCTSLAVFSGARFPGKQAFGFSDETAPVPPNHPNLKGKLLRFELLATESIVLQPGKQYAFVVMLDKMGKESGFTLANNYYGTYPDGHGIRRDGNGVFPPVAADPTKSFTDPANAKAFRSAHFPADMRQRTSIPPGTNGYPDVCTWRDLRFYVEAK